MDDTIFRPDGVVAVDGVDDIAGALLLSFVAANVIIVVIVSSDIVVIVVIMFFVVRSKGIVGLCINCC